MIRRHRFDYDLIIIGSGIAGREAALLAAREGKRVAIVESSDFGGSTINFGELPRMALLQAAAVYSAARSGASLGIRGTTVGYNYPTIKAWVESVVANEHASDTASYVEEGIDIIIGRAHFLTPNEISVDKRHVSGANFVIATGNIAVVPPTIRGLDRIPYLTASTALELLRPPKSLFIIGGGVTGVEFAEIFSTFGTKVYIAEIAPRLLPNEDVEVGEVVGNRLAQDKNADILTSTRVTSIAKEGIVFKVTYLRGDVEHVVKVEQVLLASGASAATDIGLQNAGVEYDNSGISVNDSLQTAARHIYAAGSVLGTMHGAHVARQEARVAVTNLMSREKQTVDYSSIPYFIASLPFVARVGISEQDALRRDITISTIITPISDVARAAVSDTTDGFLKLVIDKKGVLIGASMVGPCADEIISELSIAVRLKQTVRELAQTIHSYGSWGELIDVAASKA